MKAEEQYGRGGYTCEHVPRRTFRPSPLCGRVRANTISSDVGNGGYEPGQSAFGAPAAAPAYPNYGAASNVQR